MKIVDESGGDAGSVPSPEVVLPIPESQATEPQPTGLRFILRALRSRNYRLYFIGQLVSMTGNWLTSVATGWLVYRVTGSAKWLGIVGFAGQFPTFFLSPFAGVLVDRWRLRRVLVVTQILAMIESFALAAVTFAHGHGYQFPFIGSLIALNLSQGFINAFDVPSRQAFIVEMVDHREDLSNAIALNSSLVNAARLLGPSVAGIIIALTGEAWCFTLDGVTYIGVIIALLAMTVKPRADRKKQMPVLKSLIDGFSYAFGFAPIRAVLLLLALFSVCGTPYMVLMPVFAKEILHGGPKTLGLLMGASGVGALAGAVYLAARRSVLGLGMVVTVSAATFGVGLIAFSFSQHLWMSLLLMPLLGAAMIIEMSGSNTILQMLVDDDKRGRVMAFFTMCLMGMVPIGSLFGGWVADHYGAPRTVLLGGIGVIIGAAFFGQALPRLRKLIRPIYIERGILPAVAMGIRDASVATEKAAG